MAVTLQPSVLLCSGLSRSQNNSYLPPTTGSTSATFVSQRWICSFCVNMAKARSIEQCNRVFCTIILLITSLLKRLYLDILLCGFLYGIAVFLFYSILENTFYFKRLFGYFYTRGQLM